MSAFRSDLVFRDNDGLPYTLVSPLIFDSDVLKQTLIVPSGFQTDLASIPRGLWNILPKSGRYDRAAVVHDFLYQTGGCTRAEADGVLKEAMQTLKVSGWQIAMIYLGVRIGGGGIWSRYRSTVVIT